MDSSAIARRPTDLTRHATRRAVHPVVDSGSPITDRAARGEGLRGVTSRVRAVELSSRRGPGEGRARGTLPEASLAM